MDPMDFTMEDGEQPQHPNGPCTDHQHQPPSMSNNFTPQPQNAHHYDPVYNRDSWFQPNPQAPALQSVPQWGPGPGPGSGPGSLVPTSNWQSFGVDAYGGMRDDGSGYRPTIGFGGINLPPNPWNEHTRGPEPLSFRYDQSHLLTSNPPPVESGNAMISMPPTTMAASHSLDLQRQEQFNLHRQEQFRRAQNYAVNSRGGPYSTEELQRLIRQREELRNAHAQEHSTPTGAFDIPNPRRRMPQRFDMSDDEDADDPSESTRAESRRIYVERIAEEERMLASLRGAIAARKKVPTKETIAAMEKVDINELDEKDRSCMICYNDFGVENAEGLVEHAIRLPRCKHIYGDKCIKKWFENADTCPYCRDKLPSERAVKGSHSTAAYQVMQARYRERYGPGSNRPTPPPVQSQRPQHSDHSYFSTSDESTQDRGSRPHSRYMPDEARAYFRAAQQQAALQQHDSLSFSPPGSQPSARDSERRRQQGRGRGSSASARLLANATRYLPPGHPFAAESARARALEAYNASYYQPPPGVSRQSSDSSGAAAHGSVDNMFPTDPSPAIANGSNILPEALWHDRSLVGGFGPGDRNPYLQPGQSNDYPHSPPFGLGGNFSPPRSLRNGGEPSTTQPGDSPIRFRQPR